MDPKPWFEKGLRFECTGCGDCCTGAPGYVWVVREEIQKLAEHLGLSVADFEQKFVRQVGIRKSLIEFANGDCVFFDGQSRKCKVYEARPRQCRTWPFWGSNMASKESWQHTCEVCPGSGRGKLHSAEHILHQIAVVKL
ncbi:MAG TPA: YkgJ family cysteine cluster protein [Pirellulales bacterium]|nr:YkgJ family cysteine cluster protein [Pirellulales bacterium]